MKAFCIAISIFSLSSFTYGQESFTLAEALEYARSHSLDLQIKNLDIRDVDGQIQEYTAIGLPKLQANVGYNYFIKLPTSIFPNFIEPAIYDVLFDENLLPRRDLEEPGGVPVQFGTKHNLNAGLELNTLLFDGSFFIGLKAQKMYRELILKQIVQSEAELRYAVTLAYLSVLTLQENVSIVQKNLSNLQKVRNEVHEIFKAGFAEKLDVDRIDLSVQNLEAELEKLQKLTNVSTTLLQFRMNYPLDKTITLKDNLGELMNRAYLEVMNPEFQLNIQNRPEHPVILQGIRLAEMNIKRYKFSYYPSLYGFAAYQQSLQRNKLFDSNDNGWFQTSNVGVNLSWPLFTGFDRKSKIQRATVTLDKTKLQLQQFENGVQLEFRNARTEYLNAMVTLENRKKSLALAEKIYDTAKIKFKEGVGSSLEVTSAERDYFQSQSHHIEAQFQLIQAKVKLDKSMGTL
ncbi:MAG: TolC family protein [Saprospiraceae bacterium]|nr:TolC family protein [Saprospiraceae bacterium]